jgi:DSF synthase
MGVLNFRTLLSESAVPENCIRTEFNQHLHILWVTMKQAAQAHNFSFPLLHDLQNLVQAIDSAQWNDNGELVSIHYAVMKSAHPDYFNLGADLNYFRQCIRQHNREALYQYSKRCLDIVFNWAAISHQAMTTIALVQGKALGGGFEAALSSDYLIAEEQSLFGFPEIMFGLFPCTGAMSLLARRVGIYQAERMMTNTRLYSAAELKEMGIVDKVCSRGEGDYTVERFITEHARHRPARLTLQKARHRMAPLDYEELSTVVSEWTDLAMQLSEEELQCMDILIKMQKNSHIQPDIALAANATSAAN